MSPKQSTRSAIDEGLNDVVEAELAEDEAQEYLERQMDDYEEADDRGRN